jgi:predicted transcriptional regulator
MVVARKQVLVQLSDELVRRLDAEALRSDRSRSSLIREAIGAFLKPEWDEEVAKQYREGYGRLPQTDEELAWSDALTADALANREAEEGEDGW